MKNLFILFVFIILVLTIKGQRTEKRKQVLERIDVEKSQVLHFNGSLFLPRTIQVDENKVKVGAIILSLQGKNYTYTTLYDNRTYFLDLSQDVTELRVEKGDVVRINVPTKLFFAKEV
jgi:hypothetical protein